MVKRVAGEGRGQGVHLMYLMNGEHDGTAGMDEVGACLVGVWVETPGDRTGQNSREKTSGFCGRLGHPFGPPL